MIKDFDALKKSCLEYQVLGYQLKGRVVPCLLLEKPIEGKKEILEFTRTGGKGDGGWNMVVDPETKEMVALVMNVKFGDIADLKFLIDQSVIDINDMLSFMRMLVDSNGTLVIDDGELPTIGINNMSLQTPMLVIKSMDNILRKIRF